MSRSAILILLVPFYVLFNIILPLSLSFILLVVFRHIVRKVKVKLSYLELILTIGSALFILGIIVYVSNHNNSLLARLYQNPGIYLSWRFAIAFLIGVPISIAIRKYPESQPGIRSKPTSKIILFALLIFFIGLLLLPLVFFSFGQQMIFGYLQSIRYNPWQIILPILLAIGLHFYFLKSIINRSNRYRRGLFSATLIIWIIGILFLSTATVLYLRPNRYHYSNPNWQVDYLSKKYATVITYEKLHSNPQSLQIAVEQPVSTSIVFKYLTFGEKAIDYSALND
jgi:hypothetical protein